MAKKLLLLTMLVSPQKYFLISNPSPEKTWFILIIPMKKKNKFLLLVGSFQKVICSSRFMISSINTETNHNVYFCYYKICISTFSVYLWIRLLRFFELTKIPELKNFRTLEFVKLRDFNKSWILSDKKNYEIWDIVKLFLSDTKNFS